MFVPFLHNMERMWKNYENSWQYQYANNFQDRKGSSKEHIMLNLRLLMSYIYGAPILDVSRSHTTTHHSR